MVVQQVVKIEYALLRWVNRGRVGDVFVEVELLPGKDWNRSLLPRERDN